MTQVQAFLKYTQSHEWIRLESDNTAVIGITDHAQSLLGDMVLVDLPDVGAMLNAGDECAVVESVKAAADVFSPLTGEVLNHNPILFESPHLINQDPYGDGWLFRIRVDSPQELKQLLDADSYEQRLMEEVE